MRSKKMDRVAIKAHAKKSIEGKIFIILAITIIIAIIGGILGLIPVVGWLALIVLEGPIMFAEAKIFLGIVDKNRTPKIEDITEGVKGENFTRSFVGFLRYTIFTALWSLLFYIPGIIKGISYSQMFYLMAENKKWMQQKHKRNQWKSWKVTSGNISYLVFHSSLGTSLLLSHLVSQESM